MKAPTSIADHFGQVFARIGAFIMFGGSLGCTGIRTMQFLISLKSGEWPSVVISDAMDSLGISSG
jgi:hypothetical protein